LEAWGVYNLEVEVAVLDLVGKLGTGADSCLVFVEYDGGCRRVRGEGDAGCSRPAARTAVGYLVDFNIAAVELRFGCWRWCCDVEGGEEAENDSGDGVLHSEGFKKKI